MNNRERIIETVLCKEVDRLPFNFYFVPWSETIERWRTEGLEVKITGMMNKYLN